MAQGSAPGGHVRCAPRPTSQQRNGGGISVELTSHAVVARAGRRQEERRTQARTVECTHSFSIRKAPTDRRVLHISHTHTRRHCCCCFGAPGVAAPRVTLHTPFSTLIFAPLSHSGDPVEDTLASAFLCELCV